MHPPENKILNSKISVSLENKIGKGSTGDVYKGISLLPQPHPIAVKAIPLKEINNQVTGYLLQCELQALKTVSKVKNHSIVRLQEIIVIDQHCYIVMELLEGNTLKSYINEIKKLDEEKSFFILERILQGYQILKDHGIVHRDLKPDNIMFEQAPDQKLTPKIIDFGYCQIQCVKNKPKGYYNVGSPRYMSPEAYQNNQYSEKSDIWSIGIIFYEMVTGTNLDKGRNILETFQMIKEKGIPIPANFSTKTKKLLQGMLMLSPQHRMSCEQLLSQLQTFQAPKTERLNPQQILYEPKVKLLSQEKNYINEKQRKNLQNVSSPMCFSHRSEIGQPKLNTSNPILRKIVTTKQLPEENEMSPVKKSHQTMFQSIIRSPPVTLSTSTSERTIQVRNLKGMKTITENNERCSPHPGIQINFQKPSIKDRENSYSFKIFKFSQSPTTFSSKEIQTPTRIPRVPTTPIVESKREVEMPQHQVIRTPQYHYPQNSQNFLWTPKKVQFERRQFLNYSERVQPLNNSINSNGSIRKTINFTKLINPSTVISPRRPLLIQQSK